MDSLRTVGERPWAKPLPLLGPQFPLLDALLALTCVTWRRTGGQADHFRAFAFGDPGPAEGRHSSQERGLGSQGKQHLFPRHPWGYPGVCPSFIPLLLGKDPGWRQNLERDLSRVPCCQSDFQKLPPAGQAFQVPRLYFLQNGSNEEQLNVVLPDARIRSQSKLNLVVSTRGHFSNCPISKFTLQFDSYWYRMCKAEKPFPVHSQEESLAEEEEQHLE